MKPLSYLLSATGTVVVAGAVCVALYSPVANAESKNAKAAPGKHASKKAALTFAHDIAPILYQNCASCHRPGEVAPFSLLSYKDASKRAKQIALVTQSRFMPPWKAESHGEFQNERRLSAEQVAAIQQWAEEGAKEGDTSELPPAPHFAEGWQSGTPDVVLEPSESYTLAAEGEDVYRCFVIPTNYSEDRYVRAMEVRPGNRKVVHHTLVYLDTSGAARKLDADDPGPGYTSFGGLGFLPAGSLGGWAPGNLPAPLPDGIGIRLPKGADIVLQVHYHKSGKPETDQTKIGLTFCKAPVDKRVRYAFAVYPLLNIKPGDDHYTVKADKPIPTNITVLSVTPHMHLLGREMTVTATLPDGAKKPLVTVPDWDFNWQTTYTFQKPVKLPEGSSVDLTARYDNSTRNPRNPNNPPKPVHWGEQTTDEMCLAFFAYTVDSEHLTKGVVAQDLPLFGGRRRLRRSLNAESLKKTDAGSH